MPTYVYEHCEETFEVVKPMAEASSEEVCPKCGGVAEKVFTAPQISPTAKAFEAHFNHGLGKVVSSRRDIKNELGRIKSETGKEIVEVGTDTLQSVKKTRKSYEIPAGGLEDYGF